MEEEAAPACEGDPEAGVTAPDHREEGSPTYKGSIISLARLSGPLVLSNVIMLATGITDSIFLGHVSEDALAASGIANTWMWTWGCLHTSMAEGVVILASQAHGAPQ